MAGKTKEMSKIKQMLQLHVQGVSNRKISKQLEINKETVNRYVKRAESDSMIITELLKLDDPVLEHRMSGGIPAYSDERFENMKGKLPYLKKENSRKHVTLRLLWEEYIAENPDGYGLTQFRFHYNQYNLPNAQSQYTVLKDTYVGGEKIFIDFAGDTMEYTDMETGEIVVVQMFVACLPATDYGYAIGVPSQRSEGLAYSIASCFKSLGGVPKIIVPDNLKSAVIKTDPFEPEINRVMEDLANHYGCVVLPARPVHPKDKSLVEDHVKLVYQRVYAPLRNERFYSLEELNKSVAEKMKAHNQKRMQQHPYTREEQFLAIEKPELRPLPATDFEIRSYTKLKVGVNGCIYLGRDRHYYSVPHSFIGQEAKVIYTRTLVKIYCNGECIATHQRNYSAGRYTLVREHLASNSLAYRDRSPEYYVARGNKAMDELGEVIAYMFATATVPPEAFYRSCDGLLHLQRTTDPNLFRKACEAALLYQRYQYSFVLQLVKSKCKGVEEFNATEAIDCIPVPPNHSNIRGKEQFK
jgi:transposase